MKKLVLILVLALTTVLNVNAQFCYSSNSNDLSNPKVLSKIYSEIIKSGSLSGTTNPNVRYQSGYTRSNGTYVSGHYKTLSNGTNLDNYSTTPNINPFTGTTGSLARDYSSEAYNYGAGQTIYTGSRGGQYYINSNGNKTYIPKRGY
nr:hypothetical protein [uncultured Bacteroides sp.]